MNQDRKETIIKEIKYWKKTRLLPEQYCNYLLTLYTEGEEEQEQLMTNTKRSSMNFKSMFTFFIVQILLLVTVVVIYFTDFPFLLQMAFGIFCVFLISYMARKTSNYFSQLGHLYFLISAIILLLVIVHSIDQVLPGNSLVMSLVVLLNCIVWLLIGLKFKLKYFMIGGSVGVLLIIIFFLFY